jgi:hypothetical protein
MSGGNLSNEECILLLRGWCDDKRDVRALLKGQKVSFAVSGTIYAADAGGFAIEIDKDNFAGASIEGCTCGFLDLPSGEIILGREVESGIVAVRPGFDLTIMLFLERDV